jgi:hypothetical protein
MPAKRKITIKKKVKEVEKTPIVEEKIAEIEESTVSTVVENEISDVENMSGTILSTEQEIGLKNTKK